MRFSRESVGLAVVGNRKIGVILLLLGTYNGKLAATRSRESQSGSGSAASQCLYAVVGKLMIRLAGVFIIKILDLRGRIGKCHSHGTLDIQLLAVSSDNIYVIVTAGVGFIELRVSLLDGCDKCLFIRCRKCCGDYL